MTKRAPDEGRRARYKKPVSVLQKPTYLYRPASNPTTSSSRHLSTLLAAPHPIMLKKLSLLAVVVCLGGVLSQEPGPCITPVQFTARASQYDHGQDQINRWYVSYDALNKRRALFEEQNVITPGRQFLEYLELGQLNIIYEINLTKRTCKRDTMTRPWHPFGIPPNATFENEFYIGGPNEEIFAQEWSDRIPNQQREHWIGVFTLNYCYPVREVIIADNEQVNSTITTEFFDVVQGLPNPDDFIPPSYCNTAQWQRIRHPLGY